MNLQLQAPQQSPPLSTSSPVWNQATDFCFFNYIKLHFKALFFLFVAVTLLSILFIPQQALAVTELKLVVQKPNTPDQVYTINQVFAPKGQSSGGAEADFPLIPIKLLSEITQIPISWHDTPYGSALIWGNKEVAVVLTNQQPTVFAVSGGQVSKNPTIYTYELTERPLLIYDKFYVPISVLEYFGLEYRLDAYLETIYLRLPEQGLPIGNPEKIWPLVKKQVLELITPKTKRLATATTSYNPREANRTQNLLLASEAIHGYQLLPGKTFSFNRVVGERTPKKGYKRAIVFSGREKVLDYGGGICQVSTTLYQSAQRAGLKITERHSHSLPVPYANKTNDATVAWGSLDLKFYNNTGKPLYFTASLRGGKLTIQVYEGRLPKSLPNIYEIQ